MRVVRLVRLTNPIVSLFQLTWLDSKVYSVILYLFAMATVSFGLKKASDFGADPDLLATLEEVSLVLFGAVLLLSTAVGWWQIRSHGTGVETSEVPLDWHGATFGQQTFSGCAFMATTDSEGKLGPATPIAGQIDPPTAATSNPAAED